MAFSPYWGTLPGTFPVGRCPVEGYPTPPAALDLGDWRGIPGSSIKQTWSAGMRTKIGRGEEEEIDGEGESAYLP